MTHECSRIGLRMYKDSCKCFKSCIPAANPELVRVTAYKIRLMGDYTTNIGIKNEVYKRLKERKSPGQSFSGVIMELLELAEEREGVEAAPSKQET